MNAAPQSMQPRTELPPDPYIISGAELKRMRDRIEELEVAMREIAEHPKSQKGNPSWGVGWAFWHVQKIADAALPQSSGVARAPRYSDAISPEPPENAQ